MEATNEIHNQAGLGRFVAGADIKEREGGDISRKRAQAPKNGIGQVLWYHDPDVPFEVISRRVARLKEMGVVK